jgi:sec-independent protein translocase protein TatC
MPGKKYDEDLFAESSMTFGEHLEELRVCLWKAILGVVVGVIVGMFFGGWVVDLIQHPLKKALENYYQKETEAKIKNLAGEKGEKAEKEFREIVEKRLMLADEVYVNPSDILSNLKRIYPDDFKSVQLLENAEGKSENGLIPILLWRKRSDDPRTHTKSFSVYESFGIYVKAAILVGLLIASPWVFYQIWTFVAAGLYPHEKKYVHYYLPFSIALFFLGASVAFLYVFEPVLNFLFYVNKWLGIELDPRISEWLGFALLLPIGFGIGFQLPLVMYFLERVGIVSSGMFVKHWKIAVLLIWIVSTMLTPPDPFSQFFLGIPLTILYFLGIFHVQIDL